MAHRGLGAGGQIQTARPHQCWAEQLYTGLDTAAKVEGIVKSPAPRTNLAKAPTGPLESLDSDSSST